MKSESTRLISRSALALAWAVLVLPATSLAAESRNGEDRARAESERIEREARRNAEEGRRLMERQLRTQNQALRGQDDAIRDLEQARQRLEENSREVERLSNQLGRSYVYSFSTGMAGVRSPRAVLGVRIGPSTPGREGALVAEVSPGGAAAEAGIRTGDVITHLAGVDVSKASDPSRAVVEKMGQIEPDTKVQVGVLRDGRRMDFEVTARPMPAAQVAPLTMLAPLGGRQGDGGAVNLQRLRSAGDGPLANIFLGADSNRLGGMEFATVSNRLGSYFGVVKGVLVVRAGADAPFSLQDGDVILSIDGREPTSAQHVGRILRSYQPGEKVKLRVQRDRRAMDVDATAPGGND